MSAVITYNESSPPNKEKEANGDIHICLLILPEQKKIIYQQKKKTFANYWLG